MASTLLPHLISRGGAMNVGDVVRLNGPIPQNEYFAIVAFVSIALYNVIDLLCIIFTRFKRRSGLYFMSFYVATGGIPPTPSPI